MMKRLVIGLVAGWVFVDAGHAQRPGGGERIAPAHADVVYLEGTEANVLDVGGVCDF